MSVWLHCVAEGQSEKTFVDRVLAPYLGQRGVWMDARCVYTSRQGPYWKRGGVTSYGRIRSDLMIWMKQDKRRDVRFTTMFDYYRIPEDFPGLDLTGGVRPTMARVASLEQAFLDEIGDPRFVPYLEMHEFEALIFADPLKLQVMYPGEPNRRAINRLAGQRSAFPSPEDIDLDDPPSKRIQRELPQYDKVTAAAVVAGAIGIDTIRAECPHFSEWLAKLEALG